MATILTRSASRLSAFCRGVVCVGVMLCTLASCDYIDKIAPGPQPLASQALEELRMHRISIADPIDNPDIDDRPPFILDDDPLLIRLGGAHVMYLPESPFNNNDNKNDILMAFSTSTAAGFELLDIGNTTTTSLADALVLELFPRKHDPAMASFVDTDTVFFTRAGAYFPISATHIEFYYLADYQQPQDVQFIERLPLDTFPYYRDVITPVIESANVINDNELQ